MRGVAGIDDQLGFGNDAAIVVVGVVGHDDDAVVLAEVFQFGALHLQVVFPAFSDEGEVGIVVANLRSVFLQQFDDGERRRLAEIVDVFFVGHAEDEKLRAIHRFLVPVQRVAYRGENVVRHVVVDLSGKLDEAGAEIKLFGLPREIEGVNGNAMPAQAGAGVKGMKAERLGGSGRDHLPDVDVHAQAQQLEFIDQCDIDAAIDVLQQFGHLRSGRGGDRNGAIENGTVEGACQLRGLRVQSADDLRNIAAGYGGIAGVLAFGGERHEEFFSRERLVARGFKTGRIFLFEDRDHHFFRRAWVCRTLKHDQLSGTQMRSDGVGGVGDVAEIGLVVFVQRGGDANDDCIHLVMRQKSCSAELGPVEMTCTEVREDITDATKPCPAILAMSPGANTIRCRLPRTGPASLRTVRHSAVQKSVQSVRLWGLVKEAAASSGWAEKGGNSSSIPGAGSESSSGK